MIWIVDVGKHRVSHIVKITIERSIRRQDARFYDVTQNIDTFEFGQLCILTIFLFIKEKIVFMIIFETENIKIIRTPLTKPELMASKMRSRHLFISSMSTTI